MIDSTYTHFALEGIQRAVPYANSTSPRYCSLRRLGRFIARARRKQVRAGIGSRHPLLRHKFEHDVFHPQGGKLASETAGGEDCTPAAGSLESRAFAHVIRWSGRRAVVHHSRRPHCRAETFSDMNFKPRLIHYVLDDIQRMRSASTNGRWMEGLQILFTQAARSCSRATYFAGKRERRYSEEPKEWRGGTSEPMRHAGPQLISSRSATSAVARIPRFLSSRSNAITHQLGRSCLRCILWLLKTASALYISVGQRSYVHQNPYCSSISSHKRLKRVLMII